MTDRGMDDRRTDQCMHRKIMLLLHTLTMKGSDTTSLNVSSGLGLESMSDRWTDCRRTEK